MVDNELDITEIIDWQMARVVPSDEAFEPPLVAADMGDANRRQRFMIMRYLASSEL